MRPVITAAVLLAVAFIGAMVATEAQCAPYAGTPEYSVCVEWGAHVASNHAQSN